MTDYTAKEVERALLPYVGGYFGDMTEAEEAVAEEAANNDRTWEELEYTLKGSAVWGDDPAVPPVTHIEVRGEQAEIEVVEDHGGGEGSGEERWIVVRVGTQFFRQEGYYVSHYGSEFDGDFKEVHKTERMVTFYE